MRAVTDAPAPTVQRYNEFFEGLIVTYPEIVEREQKYLLNTYARYPIAMARGKGVYLYDVEGKRYLDLLSGLGVNALGHAHPRIVKVIREQAAKVIHLSNLYYNEYQGLLAEELCTQVRTRPRLLLQQRHRGHRRHAEAGARCRSRERRSGEKSSWSRWTTPSTDAPWALSLSPARPSTARTSIPCWKACASCRATMWKLCATPWMKKSAASCSNPSRAKAAFRKCPPEFLRACREAADQHHAALIFDEIQCGMGRTGQLFAFQHFGVMPDVVCIAKPMAAGLPMGAFLAKQDFAQHLTPGKHGTTFGGGPLACRVALEYLAILEDENLLEQVRRVGAYFSQKLRELVEKFDIAVEARGVGAIQALQLTVPGKPILEGAHAHGLLINVTQDTVLRFLPPFLLQEKHVDVGSSHFAQAAGCRAEGTQEGGEGCKAGGDGGKVRLAPHEGFAMTLWQVASIV